MPLYLGYNACVGSPHKNSSVFTFLRHDSRELWDRAMDHPFVHALADESLGRDKFIHYLEQDYVYLQAYARAISLAAAKAPGLVLMAELSALAHETLNTEMQLHRDYCAEYGISEEQLSAVRAAPICQAYGDFCISTAASEDCAGLLAALIPCGVGYAEIGQRLAEQAKSADHPYMHWIDLYASAEYQSYAEWMKNTLDALAQDASKRATKRLSELFVLGCRYEWLFWEMAWSGADWPI